MGQAGQATGIDIAVLQQLISDYHFYSAKEYLLKYQVKPEETIIQWLDLAHAYLHTDLSQFDRIALQLGLNDLQNQPFLAKRVYSFTQAMAVKLAYQELDDYLRALTPLLVDVLRLLIQKHLLPDLDRYLVKVTKETTDGRPLYRGLQWNQSVVEASDNIIHKTWKKYYGDHFNYDNYVSSSHLLKIVADYLPDEKIRQQADEMRQIEKYARNIVAHELVYVNDGWLIQRVGKNSQQIHQSLLDLIHSTGLQDPKQWEILQDLRAAILEASQRLYTSVKVTN